MIKEVNYPKKPRGASWWYKSAGVATIWFGTTAALFMTVFAASVSNFDASRFNRPGILIGAATLAIAGGLFTASWLTKADRTRPVYQDYTEAGEGVDYDLVDAR